MGRFGDWTFRRRQFVGDLFVFRGVRVRVRVRVRLRVRFRIRVRARAGVRLRVEKKVVAELATPKS